jgi:nitroreductase
MSTWHELLALAIRAPSPHNVQPWRVRLVDHRTAELHLEKARTLPAEDESGSYLLLTMGLFVESLRVIAAHRGLALRAELVHPPEWFRASNLATVDLAMLPFATLKLSRGPTADLDFDEAAFLRRRTSRLAYAPDPLPEGAARELMHVARAAGTRFDVVRDPAVIDRLLDWNVAAVFEDLNHAGYHGELTSWFRIDDSAARRHADGLDARCMNQSPFELELVRAAPWILRLPLLAHAFAVHYRRQIGPVATIGVLSGGFWDPAHAYADGRALIHFWVAVERLGYSLHPYGNLATNRPVAARVAREIGIADPWLVFKIGRSPEAPLSYRRSVEQVLL